MNGSSDRNGTQGAGAHGFKYVSLLWALPEHAGAIAQLHAGSFDEAWDADAVARLLSNPGSIAMLASAGMPAVMGAFVLAQVAADEAEILTIAVDPAWRRQGIAARLVDGVKRGALRGGARHCSWKWPRETARPSGSTAKPDSLKRDAEQAIMRAPMVLARTPLSCAARSSDGVDANVKAQRPAAIVRPA